MKTEQAHPRTMVGATAIREMRWLRRHNPAVAGHCNDIEAAIRREVRRGIERERRAARRAKQHDHTPEAA